MLRLIRIRGVLNAAIKNKPALYVSINNTYPLVFQNQTFFTQTKHYAKKKKKQIRLSDLGPAGGPEKYEESLEFERPPIPELDEDETPLFLQEGFVLQEKREIRDALHKKVEQVIFSITKEDGYIPEDITNFVIEDPELRFKILTKCMQVIGRELPSTAVRKLKTGKDLVDWFVEKALSERPPKSMEIPPNVRLLIEKHERTRSRNEKIQSEVKMLDEIRKQKKRELRRRISTTTTETTEQPSQ